MEHGIIYLRPFAETVIAICRQLISNIRSDGKSQDEIIAETLAREPLPEIAVLEAVLTNCYQASMQTNEGRACCFNIVFTRENAPSFPRCPRISCANQLALSAETLTMMSTVHNARAGALLWEVSDGKAFIKEIIAHPPDLNNGAHYSPGGLQISCIGPGRIDVKYLMHSIAAIDGTRVTYAILGQSIDPFEYVGTAVWNQKSIIGLDLLVSMIERIKSHGHGGSIWIADIDDPDDIKIKFPVSQERNHRSSRGMPTPWQYLDQYARLANTDGAVLFNWQGILLGFGVFGNVDKDKHVRVLGSTDDLGVRSIETIGGARKQSAATFVARHDGAAALVVSQDGQATIIHRDGDDVVCAAVGVRLLPP